MMYYLQAILGLLLVPFRALYVMFESIMSFGYGMYGDWIHPLISKRWGNDDK